jgi:predicted DNA repair protein MutK
VSPLYVAAGFLVAAQIVGIYALRTRKADLLFSILMVVLVGVAIALAVYGINGLRHL